MSLNEVGQWIFNFVIGGAIATFIGTFLWTYITTPMGMIEVDGKCPTNLGFENSRYNPQLKNMGETDVQLTICISSKEFLINNNLDHTPICQGWANLPRDYNQRKMVAYAPWDLTVDKNLLNNLNQLSFKIDVQCKQKLWFVSWDCPSPSYQCKYIKKESNLQIAPDSINP